jgi:hypothetical protein
MLIFIKPVDDEHHFISSSLPLVFVLIHSGEWENEKFYLTRYSDKTMKATIEYPGKELQLQETVALPFWQRFILLFILGYEAASCLLGGSLLVAAPDGRYMDMPVDMMRGVFPDFLVPGIILFGLGVLNTLAFITVLRRRSSDWFMAGLALGGLFIWFIVEIIIIRELHWLHLMWGIPVLLGWMAEIPLILLRHDTLMMRKFLLMCGVFSSAWYLVINILVPVHYDGYDPVTLTVSELSAFGAPTRIEWILLCVWYPLLLMAFGWGVLNAERGNRLLRIAEV